MIRLDISYNPPTSCKVYTPAPLAAAMIAAIAGTEDSDWLEPSFGTGVFLRELNRIGVRKHKMTAVDLDPCSCESDIFAHTARSTDFLQWSQHTTQRFDRVVANPPYVSLLELPEHARGVARQLTLPSGNGALPARSNLWAAFILATIRTLKKNGSIAFVLPAAWEYADYARSLRNELPKLFSEWFCLRCEEPLFEGVSEGSVVLVGRGFGQTSTCVARLLCTRMEDLVVRLRQLADRNPAQLDHQLLPPPAALTGSQEKLSNIVDIRLGGVTGDADYFLLRESERKELGLPESCLKPTLSKADHLKCAFINKKAWDCLRANDARVWMFRPSKEQTKHRMVKRYLRLGREDGGCDRTALKVRIRTPWYQVPLPHRIDGFASGMSSTGPWMALTQMPGLTASNTLYTIRFKKRMNLSGRASLALALLSSPVREQLPNVCRRYAAGLGKFEPSDLQNLSIPIFIPTPRSVLAYKKAVEALLSGSSELASKIADECLGL